MRRGGWKGLVLSLLVHGGVLAFLLIGFHFAGPAMPPAGKQGKPEPIQATVVNEKQIAEEEAKLKAREKRKREAEQARQRKIREERERLQKLKQQREAAQQAAVEQKRKQEEAAKQAAAEKAKAEKLRKQREEAERKRKAEEARKKKEAEERRKREEAERKRKEAAAKARKQREAELKQQLAAEARRQQAVEAGLLAQYKTSIAQKVNRNWYPPANVPDNLDCTVLVTQIPGGDVVGVKVTECNGDETVVRSIENAVRRASPMPPPPKGGEMLFDRQIQFHFRPNQ